MENIQKINMVTGKIIQAAIEVHRELGPGLLESAYETCLHFELINLGMHIARQKPLPVVYKNIKLDCGYRIDLLVEDLVVVEVKAIVAILPVHKSQLLSYLRLSSHRVGLLINFHVQRLQNGIARIINGY